MQIYHSKSVYSEQSSVDKNLHNLVIKHRDNLYRKPIQAHNQLAFERFTKAYTNQPLILDSCCGTAMSSVKLAKKFSKHLVVGIDQSKHRLNKQNNYLELPHNCLLLQTNCEDFWRLCLENNIYFDKHFILYPNPWPKTHHLKRRWHGHPSFVTLPKLSKSIELRSNWLVYLQEFAYAWQLLSEKRFEVNELKVSEPLTLFEKKYSASGQPLYQLKIS